jgi:hypothetical protein
VKVILGKFINVHEHLQRSQRGQLPFLGLTPAPRPNALYLLLRQNAASSGKLATPHKRTIKKHTAWHLSTTRNKGTLCKKPSSPY